MLLKKLIIGLICTLTAIPGMALEISREKTVKLTPHMRVENLNSVKLPESMRNAIKPFLKKDLVIEDADLSRYPYVVAFPDSHTLAALGEEFYARGTFLPTMPSYVVVRAGKPYVDPETKEILGYGANYVATANMQQMGDPATLNVVDYVAPVLEGDRLITGVNTALNLAFDPHPANAKLSGRIISVLDDGSNLALAGKYSVVVINRGTQDGVTLGDILTISTPGKVIKDAVDESRKPVVLPAEKLGKLMVFKVFNRVSFALITEAGRSVTINDQVGTL